MATVVNLYGRNEFRKQPETVNVAEIVRELAEIRIETDPAWARNPGSNLFGALCKNPHVRVRRGGCDTLMAQERLDIAQVGSSLVAGG
jgi:hypothetical protein